MWLTAAALLIQRYELRPVTASPQPVPVQALADARLAGGPRVRPVGSRPARLLIPVSGVLPHQLVNTFSQARASGARVHNAIDIMAPRGTPVLAAAPGRVEKLFVSDRGGKTVYQRSPDGQLIYYYAHLDAYAPGLAEGQRLRAGQPIGTVGISGNADPAGPHLHFAVQRTTPQASWYDAATPLNPYPLLTGR
jgi:murein DD-endopeptidase MepM/ murein hydrolase activator NlpD